MISKTVALRRLLLSPELAFIMEAHNAISAVTVEEVGFKAIWASSLSISASLGVRDSNEASWTQIVDVVEFMSDATEIPILVDGDTGYGNFNNTRRLVRKLEQRGIAGVCIEDKLFPKMNSLIRGHTQALADTEEFSGKIKAAKDTQSDDDFCVIARVEAFVAGFGVAEALRRAEAYRKAGADAILIHSSRTDCTEIEMFANEWCNRHPLVIVPTRYYPTPTQHFKKIGISAVIWANHCIRASILATRKIARQIFEEESVVNVEHRIAPISEVWRLQRMAELDEAEKAYLPRPRNGTHVTAIALAGNAGAMLERLTEAKPKCMIKVQGTPILHHLVQQLNDLKVRDIVVIRGYCKDAVQPAGFRTIDNVDYATSQGFHSLYLAYKDICGDTLICYGDSLFRRHLIEHICSAPGDFSIVVDADLTYDSRLRDLVICDKRYRNEFANGDVSLNRIYISREPEGADGEWAGLLFVRANAVERFKAVLDDLHSRANYRDLHLADMIQELAMRERVGVVYTKRGWLDVDTYQDLEAAGEF